MHINSSKKKTTITTADKSNFLLLLQETVGASSKFQQLTPRTLVEINDLDAVTGVSEVEEVLKNLCKDAVS